jgi:hypothetical protein
MSWTDFYRRREILEAAIRHAGRAPGEPLTLEEIPGAADAFGSEENLLLAMQYKWSQLLGGHLRAELADPADAAADTVDSDQVDAVSRAWRRAQSENEALRAVLDGAQERHPVIARQHEGELRMLAITAGLAEPGEPVEEITKVGRTLDALVRAGDARPARRRSPMGHLMRLLAPSA